VGCYLNAGSQIPLRFARIMAMQPLKNHGGR